MITVTTVGFDKYLGSMHNQGIRAAGYRAINRAIDGGVTDVSREVCEVYNVSKRDVDQRIQKIKCASYYDLHGEVIVKGGDKSALPLILFKAVERRNLESGAVTTKKGKNGFVSTRLKRKTAQVGVTYQVLKSGGKGYSAKAFILAGGRGSLQVVRRKAGVKGNAGLKEKRVISIAAMVGSLRHGVKEKITAAMQRRLATNLESEMRYYKQRIENGQRIGGK